MSRNIILLFSFFLMLSVSLAERYVCIQAGFVGGQINYFFNIEDYDYCKLPRGFMVKHIFVKTSSSILTPTEVFALGYTDYPEEFIPFDFNVTTDMVNEDNLSFIPKQISRGVKTSGADEAYLTLTPWEQNISGGQLEVYIEGEFLPSLL